MRLFLSSYRLGHHPQALLQLLGPGRRTAVIFNAADYKDPSERAESLAGDLQELRELGLDPFEVDLRAYFHHEPGLEVILSQVDLIWVRGGNCFILRRALKQSGADDLIKELLLRDAVVYGGFSAGIDMLAPSLEGVELVDDPHLVPDGYDPEIVWDCLGLLPFSVAPHYKSDHPESAQIADTIEYMIEHHLPFIALKDGQALVIDGDNRQVLV